jgi:hypothetical protein
VGVRAQWEQLLCNKCDGALAESVEIAISAAVILQQQVASVEVPFLGLAVVDEFEMTHAVAEGVEGVLIDY